MPGFGFGFGFCFWFRFRFLFLVLVLGLFQFYPIHTQLAHIKCHISAIAAIVSLSTFNTPRMFCQLAPSFARPPHCPTALRPRHASPSPSPPLVGNHFNFWSLNSFWFIFLLVCFSFSFSVCCCVCFCRRHETWSLLLHLHAFVYSLLRQFLFWLQTWLHLRRDASPRPTTLRRISLLTLIWRPRLTSLASIPHLSAALGKQKPKTRTQRPETPSGPSTFPLRGVVKVLFFRKNKTNCSFAGELEHKNVCPASQ